MRPLPRHRARWGGLFWGGVVPILAFTIIEDRYGTWWGLIAGLVFAAGEMTLEFIRHRKISRLTLLSGALLIALGLLSLWTDDGLWFKLQPALFEAFFAFALWGSLFFEKNLIEWMAAAQGRELPGVAKPFLRGLTFRLGLFFALQAALATWAAFAWSTQAWAFLKSVGILVFLAIYMGAEFFLLRRRLRHSGKS
ncbi:MAG TPA: septation protein IspZ [Pseudobdellovibrionaceae bacterium]|nr:septation protein IspZ [Pseudobdellovibrionaceae bacterium]